MLDIYSLEITMIINNKQKDKVVFCEVKVQVCSNKDTNSEGKVKMYNGESKMETELQWKTVQNIPPAVS